MVQQSRIDSEFSLCFPGNENVWGFDEIIEAEWQGPVVPED